MAQLRIHHVKTLAALLVAPVLLSASGPVAYTTWSDYGGSADSAQYSALNQINRANVTKLRVAWRYATGDSGKYFFNPLVAHGLLYVLAKNNSIVALDAASGKELWVHPVIPQTKLITDRGINYWESADGSDRRLLFAADNLLQAIDARTGRQISSFGRNGIVDLREGLGRDPKTLKLVQSTTPGRVYRNLLILGSATNEEYHSAPGDIRAYDVRDGRLVWSFHTIPHEGEYGYSTWPKEAWKHVGGANAWSELTVDVVRGIVYVPTASPKYNFYGANRPGENLFGDSLLALDARTGKRIWHFQMVHHDIWDYDNATAPKLLTVHHHGKKIDIVAQPGKEGFLWVFDRATGKPVWPIEERPVPKSDMPGEQTWPTQPFPTWPKPFARQKFTAADLSPFIKDPAERARIKDEIESARNQGMFTPPSTQGTIEMPGNNGGANLGGAAVDPMSGMLYIVSKDLPALLKLKQTAPGEYKTPFGFLFASSGLPVIAPPWTTLTAYDMNTGAIRWQRPLGEVPSLAAEGFHETGSHFPKVGPVVTAGGLIFTGTRDGEMRALDSATGKVLWKAQAEAGLEGMPAVYEINGREYVVFCAAAQNTTYTHDVPGHPASKASIPGAYIALALGE